MFWRNYTYSGTSKGKVLKNMWKAMKGIFNSSLGWTCSQSELSKN